MKQFTVLTVGLLLIAGSWTATKAQTTEDPELKCEEGSDLFDPPECPDTDPDKPVYFPFPYNCRQYFECTNTIARCIHCSPGTIWDQEALTCNHESSTNCTIVTTTTALPTTTTPTTTPTTTTPTTTTPTTTTPTTTTPTTTTPTTTTTTTTTEPPTTEDPEDPINWICPENYDGLIRHPYDCRFFYNCDPARRPCLFECADGLYFNPANDWCDFPFNVPDCEGGTPPPTSTTPITTGLKGDSSLNYRNLNRRNFAETVRYVSKMLKSRVESATDNPDPCELIRTYLDN